MTTMQPGPSNTKHQHKHHKVCKVWIPMHLWLCHGIRSVEKSIRATSNEQQAPSPRNFRPFLDPGPSMDYKWRNQEVARSKLTSTPSPEMLAPYCVCHIPQIKFRDLDWRQPPFQPPTLVSDCDNRRWESRYCSEISASCRLPCAIQQIVKHHCFISSLTCLAIVPPNCYQTQRFLFLDAMFRIQPHLFVIPKPGTWVNQTHCRTRHLIH